MFLFGRARRALAITSPGYAGRASSSTVKAAGVIFWATALNAKVGPGNTGLLCRDLLDPFLTAGPVGVLQHLRRADSCL
jgi:hypothetical protein